MKRCMVSSMRIDSDTIVLSGSVFVSGPDGTLKELETLIGELSKERDEIIAMRKDNASNGGRNEKGQANGN